MPCKSSVPSWFLSSPLTESEHALLVSTVRHIGPKTMNRALASYEAERALRPTPRPFAYHICYEPHKRGLSRVAIQLFNVTSTTAFGFFKRLIQTALHASPQESEVPTQ